MFTDETVYTLWLWYNLGTLLFYQRACRPWHQSRFKQM